MGSYWFLSERISIWSARVDQYKEKLDGASPEQAAKRMMELKRAAVRTQLQRFHDQLGSFIDRRLAKDIPVEEYTQYGNAAHDAFTDTYTYVRNNLGIAYVSRLTDGQNQSPKTWPQGISADHNQLISNLTIYRNNLETLIKSDAWEPRL